MRGRRVQLRDHTHENSLIPFLNSGSSSTLYVRIFSCGTPCRSKTCMTAREKPHCGNSGVPFIKRTSGEASMAFWICTRASEERSRRRANDVAAGDPRVKGESWGKHEHIKAWTLLCNPFTHREPRDRPEHGRSSDGGQLRATWLVDSMHETFTSPLTFTETYCSPAETWRPALPVNIYHHWLYPFN